MVPPPPALRAPREVLGAEEGPALPVGDTPEVLGGPTQVCRSGARRGASSAKGGDHHDGTLLARQPIEKLPQLSVQPSGSAALASSIAAEQPTRIVAGGAPLDPSGARPVAERAEGGDNIHARTVNGPPGSGRLWASRGSLGAD